jgi:hypothetical protein
MPVIIHWQRLWSLLVLHRSILDHVPSFKSFIVSLYTRRKSFSNQEWHPLLDLRKRVSLLKVTLFLASQTRVSAETNLSVHSQEINLVWMPLRSLRVTAGFWQVVGMVCLNLRTAYEGDQYLYLDLEIRLWDFHQDDVKAPTCSFRGPKVLSTLTTVYQIPFKYSWYREIYFACRSLRQIVICIRKLCSYQFHASNTSKRRHRWEHIQVRHNSLRFSSGYDIQRSSWSNVSRTWCASPNMIKQWSTWSSSLIFRILSEESPVILIRMRYF